MAALVMLTPGMIVGSEGQTILPPTHGNRPVQSQSSSGSLLAAQGRRQPGYQVFAARFTLPPITVKNGTTLKLGDAMEIDVNRLDQLTRPQKEALAGRLKVPIGVVDSLLKSLAHAAPADAAHTAGKIRDTVIDYKYLLEKWTRCTPPAGREKVRTNALLALRRGDLYKAWGLFVELPQPKPLTALRIAG